MKRGDLSITASSLNFAMKTLKMSWEDAKEVWDDSVRQSFDEEHMVPLEPQVMATLKAINRLNQVMARAYEECT